MLPASIRSLAFPVNAIENTRGLDGFATLSFLDLSHNQIDDISELSSLVALRTLHLVGNKISDLGPLAACAALETLDISGNDITDLRPLASCKKLKNLTISGTMYVSNGVEARSTNPVEDVRGLGGVPALANPFFLGEKLKVRFGILPEGPDAQFVGEAQRIGQSCSYKVTLTRGVEVVQDVWTLRVVRALSMQEADDFRLFVPGMLAADTPSSGASLSIVRASREGRLELNLSYVDPDDPRKAGIDTTRYPVFAERITFPTFDAEVVAL
jgi:Leucine-rich repeat (LRR) protein